ncbi:MAG: hypothetical protein CMJ78_27695 [Planctomycetaceae bacterium]|nr:hypothetical protein [Planctomycetaceae bacterium]
MTQSRSMSIALVAFVTCMCNLSVNENLLAQDFRVYTRIYDLSKPAGSSKEGPAVVGRIMSLFHHGQVYDYIDGVGQVTVFDPVQRRFIIMNGKQMISTVVEFDEVTQWVKLAESRAKEKADTLRLLKDKESLNTMRLLEFLMVPEFETTMKDKQLSLRSRVIDYEVTTVKPKHAEAVDAYLKYADWIKRMNSMMHPEGLLPAPRIALNAELRKRRLLATEVNLSVKIEQPIRLRAVHQIYWSLGPSDRQDIARWKKRINHPDMQKLSMREYLAAIQ